ncbi:MAG: translation initiation factor IF-6 [Candidatus Heimdallarchaeota archaeon]
MDNLHSIDLLGNSSIGIFSMATNSYAIFPYATKPRTFDIISQTLDVPIIQSTVANCNLLGLFTCGNTHNLILPDLVSEDEFILITSKVPDDVEIHTFNSKITALGNSIVCSDSVAIVHAEFTSSEIKLIENYLDVEVIKRRVNNSPLVGSLIFRNDNGFLTHPLITLEELEWLSNTFKTRGDVVTINRGTPYPRPGIVGNNKGVLIGSDSSGPELMRVFDILLS